MPSLPCACVNEGVIVTEYLLPLCQRMTLSLLPFKYLVYDKVALIGWRCFPNAQQVACSFHPTKSHNYLGTLYTRQCDRLSGITPHLARTKSLWCSLLYLPIQSLIISPAHGLHECNTCGVQEKEKLVLVFLLPCPMTIVADSCHRVSIILRVSTTGPEVLKRWCQENGAILPRYRLRFTKLKAYVDGYAVAGRPTLGPSREPEADPA